MSSDGSTVLFGALPAKFKFSASDKRVLTRFARKLSAQLAHGKYFECLITDDREMQRLNDSFLKHNYPTDVLSFPTAGQPFAIGECAISVERAADQSRRFGHSLIAELQILMLHGVLHLTGFDHENDTGEMARSEMRWRAQLKLPQSLIERSQQPAASTSL
jgi:probable rRNA maturation factor